MKILRMIRHAVQKLFSRMFVVGLGILIQLAWLFCVLYSFSAQFTFANLMMTIAGLLTAVYVVSRPGDLAASWPGRLCC